MPGEYSSGENLQPFGSRLIGEYHPDLVNARIEYVFCEKSSKRNGVSQFGKVHLLSGWKKHFMDMDYLIEVALDLWNDMDDSQRLASMDHLLERCYGEEDDSGEVKWKIRDPEIQEFASILSRHGAYHEGLVQFVGVAHSVQIDAIIEEETDVDVDEVLTVTSTD